jgi:hypothetical protein
MVFLLSLGAKIPAFGNTLTVARHSAGLSSVHQQVTNIEISG